MTGTTSAIVRKAGLPPGTLVHLGERKTDKVRVTVIDFNDQFIEERDCNVPEDCFEFRDSDNFSWINVDGLHDVQLVEALGNHFGIHALTLEDILDTNHRPIVEMYDAYTLFIIKMIGLNEQHSKVVIEHISLVVGNNWLITFQEREGDLFDPLRDRLRNKGSVIRERGINYLAYRLMDIVVDNYFAVSEYFFDHIHVLEQEILESPERSSLEEVQLLKKQVFEFRKRVYPLREMFAFLTRDETQVFKKATKGFLRDLLENTNRIIDRIETHRDSLSNITELYNSQMSFRMNEVMKVLTIIATIFIPLSFIAGVYGMNFDHMPELHWRYSYFVIWGVMLSVIIGMLVYFRRKRWL